MSSAKPAIDKSSLQTEKALRRRIEQLEADVSEARKVADDASRSRDQVSRTAKAAVRALSRQLGRSYANSLSIKSSIKQLLNAIANRLVPKRAARAKIVAAIRKSGYFDYRYYLQTHEDVAVSRVDPIEHFVATGWKAGRRPNRWFDPKWYVRTYPDAKAKYGNPLLHYVRKGAADRRRTSKAFDPQKYLSDNPDVADTGMEPLYHLVNYGQFEGRVGSAKRVPASPIDPRFLKIHSTRDLGFLTKTFPASKGEVSTQSLGPSSVALLGTSPIKVSVVVPVYGDRDLTVKCLDSVVRSIPHNKSFHKLIIIDDVGPDETLRNLLHQYAGIAGVELHINSSNLGFVKSTNIGLAIADRTDVVLLNSDTEVNADWLDRLVAHAADPRVGTVTPLSNNATICSFPDIGASRDLPADQSLSTIDRTAAATNSGRAVPVPTGVGFCMYVRRAALDECGVLDEEAFGAGYGEETDFCQRIQARGWKNLLAGDVFVFHKGGASFGTSSNARKEKAGAIMRQRYPDYERSVTRWVENDPALTMRLALEVALLRQKRPAMILHITHPWGGGVERHISELVAKTETQASHVVAMLGQGGGGVYEHKLLLPDDEGRWRQFAFKTRTAEAIADLIKSIGPTRIHVHHGLPDMSFIMSVLVSVNIEYDISIHDYWPICARMNLSIDGEYCGEPDEFACLECLAKTAHLAGQDVIAWREQSRFLLDGASRVITPSSDVAKRIEARFPNAVAPIVAPHELDNYHPLSRELKAPGRRGPPFRIAVVGALNVTKGGEFLLDVVEAAVRLGLEFQWVLVGYFYPPLDQRAARLSSVLSCSGRYENSTVDQLLEDADADIAFFPQRIPETYSYTLTEAFKAGLPTLTSNIGAFVERVEGVPGCWTYATDDSPEAVALKLQDALSRLAQGPLPEVHLSEAKGPPADFYRDEYIGAQISARSPSS